MSEYRVASRYAKSLIELSKEKGVLEQVKNDITLFKNTADSSRELAVMLKSPVVSHLKKGTILKALFAGKVTELTLAFFDIICRKNREAVLQAVAVEFLKQYDIVKGIQKATLITSAEISDDVRAAFEKAISKMAAGKEVSLTTKVDESLIGGYVLQVGDKQIDDSVKGRLDRLRADLV